MKLVEVLFVLQLVKSKSEARRFIKAGAVRVNQEKITDVNFNLEVTNEYILQIGKRKFAKVKMCGEPLDLSNFWLKDDWILKTDYKI